MITLWSRGRDLSSSDLMTNVYFGLVRWNSPQYIPLITWLRCKLLIRTPGSDTWLVFVVVVSGMIHPLKPTSSYPFTTALRSSRTSKVGRPHTLPVLLDSHHS
ncbi:hypothetical protein BDM02DRAFT_2638682 [Thelephora ganbajun]|uniref:Uncharacterized protein n=1 Tax=Thelephora ganbajun TaxID=370292 RepID=A0ACB6ZDH9_THEGA|nr:hypothetical protein BDM02DRAFT_2638682 [Thelephora ganbajun]